MGLERSEAGLGKRILCDDNSPGLSGLGEVARRNRGGTASISRCQMGCNLSCTQPPSTFDIRALSFFRHWVLWYSSISSLTKRRAPWVAPSDQVRGG